MALEIFVVSEEEAKESPYPFIYVNEDGSFRELTKSEKSYLETGFHPFDGARPYVKPDYDSRNPAGRRAGFLLRSQLPKE